MDNAKHGELVTKSPLLEYESYDNQRLDGQHKLLSYIMQSLNRARMGHADSTASWAVPELAT